MTNVQDAPGVTRAAFRDAMARLGAAVHVITTDGPGERAGFTASAVCSVTDTPPTLLVCLNRSASVYDAFLANRAVCVNTLAHGHEPLSDIFGGKTSMDERFALGTWSTLVTGAPVLDGAVVSFDCRVTQVVNVGTHDVMMCEVVAIGVGTGEAGLFYFDRRYHRLG
jgi:flavin reductase